MEIKQFRELPPEAILIRNEVFVQEQGFENEFDSIDDISTHLVLFDDALPVATCRYFWDENKKSYIVGRIAVRKQHRGKKLGEMILREAEKSIKELGGSSIYLSAQLRVSKFYVNQGYRMVGEAYYDEFCEHIWMMKEL